MGATERECSQHPYPSTAHPPHPARRIRFCVWQDQTRPASLAILFVLPGWDGGNNYAQPTPGLLADTTPIRIVSQKAVGTIGKAACDGSRTKSFSCQPMF